MCVLTVAVDSLVNIKSSYYLHKAVNPYNTVSYNDDIEWHINTMVTLFLDPEWVIWSQLLNVL